jgi:hypothetical protein
MVQRCAKVILSIQKQKNKSRTLLTNCQLLYFKLELWEVKKIRFSYKLSFFVINKINLIDFKSKI